MASQPFGFPQWKQPKHMAPELWQAMVRVVTAELQRANPNQDILGGYLAYGDEWGSRQDADTWVWDVTTVVYLSADVAPFESCESVAVSRMGQVSVVQRQIKKDPYWEVDTEKTEPHWLEVSDAEEGSGYAAIVKSDGCIHLNDQNTAQPEEAPDYLLICDLDTFISRLQALREVAHMHFHHWPLG